MDVKGLLDSFVDLLVDRLASKLRGRELVDQNNAPCGKRRFLEAARRGEFPSIKKGKLVTATRADVDAWMEASKRLIKPAPAPEPSEFDPAKAAAEALAPKKKRRGTSQTTVE